MTDIPKITADGKIELTDSELQIMQQLLDAHDRGGFYMAYEAMTDSVEAGLQSRISGAAIKSQREGQQHALWQDHDW